MSKKFLPLLSLVLFTCGSIDYIDAAPAAIEAYESRTIARIDVAVENLPPGHSFDPKAVVARLKTKIGDPFSQSTFDADLKALSEEYDRVDPIIDVRDGELYITIKVWPRPTIRAIKWEGNKHVTTKTLRKELGIKTSATFNRQAFNKAFNKLKEYYVKKGYFESQLQYSVITDAKTNEVEISILIKEGRSGKIDDIVFKGFTSDEKSEILEMIYTKKYSLLTSWFTGTGQYQDEAIDQDKLTIVNYMQNHGYADAKVDILVKESKANGRIILVISVDRGALFHFGRITFDGNTLFTDKQIEQLFSARPEGVYSPDKLRESADAIKELYGRRGHIDANVQYETRMVENEPVYNAHFTIEEGGEYKIGLIRVFGNIQTQTHVILRESLLVPGETFDTAKLKATQRRLENIGYFKNVNVYAVRTQDDQDLGDNYRDVYIEVEETTTGNISLFFGFSSADDVFGGLDLVETNFNYKGITKIFSKGPSAIRGGGEYAHARASLGARQQTYSISWMTPYFRDTLWRLGFEASHSTSRLQSKHYHIMSDGLTLFASYPLSYYWTFGCKYRVRYAHTRLTGDPTPQEEKQIPGNSILSAASASIGFDSTDSARKPHNGFRSMLESEFAGIGGDVGFLRLGYINSYYTSLWPRGIMKYRFDLKFIEPLLMTHNFGKIPVSERFFLGGENSVRGYKPFDLGPHFANGDPKGGISSSLMSIEYLHEMSKFLDLFVFADAGNVSSKRFFVGKYNFSYGIGARVEIAGRLPIIIGWGNPINASSKDQIQRLFFSMGGQF